jgi:hypothetical protein
MTERETDGLIQHEYVPCPDVAHEHFREIADEIEKG